jgi:hypothetical protein
MRKYAMKQEVAVIAEADKADMLVRYHNCIMRVISAEYVAP